ncbi:MAG: DUF1858 domain-containing protein [Anaerovoracaceae bacterium]
MKKITEDMKIFEVLDINPKLENVFLDHGLNCVGCPGGSTENLGEAAEGHGISLEKLLKDLNEANEL